jgi:hypothetical protein
MNQFYLKNSKKIYIVMLVTCILLLPLSSKAAETLNPESEKALTEFLKTVNVNAQGILQSNDKIPFSEIRAGSRWIIADLIQNKDKQCYIEFPNPFINTANIWLLDEKWQILSEQSILHSHPHIWSVRNFYINICHEIESLKKKRLEPKYMVIEIKSLTSVRADYFMLNHSEMILSVLRESFFSGSYFFTMIIMLLFNISVYLQNKDPHIRRYLIYLLINIIFQVQNSGLVKFLMPDFSEIISAKSENFLGGLAFSATVYFSLYFINLKDRFPRMLQLK